MAIALSGCAGPSAGTASAAYEVWVVDQSDSPGRNFGGLLYVYDGETLAGEGAANATPTARIDLGEATAALCLERTGAPPVRPHMLLFNEPATHAVISFVASGHVAVMDAASREPVDCLRTSQSPTGQQAHAAFPSPDGSYILVANQSGKRLERIDANFAAGRFVMNDAATLDLATCTTPSGAPCEAAETRPLNWPICPIVDRTGNVAFVTLRGGGMLVVDPRRTPMTVIGEYDMATIEGNGCGGVQVDEVMFLNSGGSPVNVSGTDADHPSLYGFDVYRMPVSGYSPTNAPNVPLPEPVYSKEGAGDSHGMVAAANGRFVWVFDRHSNRAEVLSTESLDHVASVDLVGDVSDDPAPDLADVSPDGSLLFFALRGASPLSGDPHNSRGSTPGLGIIRVEDGGASGVFATRVPVTNVDAEGIDRADVHAVRVRRK
jgi:DNA-binding beta-propeller fold protein YncE